MPDEQPQPRITITDLYTSSFHVGDDPQKAPLVEGTAAPQTKRQRLAAEKAERAAERPVGVFTGYTREEELQLTGVDPKTMEAIEKARAERIAAATPKDAPPDAATDEPARVRDIPTGTSEPRRSQAVTPKA